VVLGVAILYIACAKLGLALAFRAAQVTAVWPPTGFALAAVFRFGWRAVPGVLLGAFLANASADEPLWVAAAIAIGNTLEAVAGVTILRRLGFDGRHARVRDIFALLGALVVAPLVSATIGVTSLGIGRVQSPSSLPALWWLWWLGDALGGLIVAPLLLVWSDRDRMPDRPGAPAEAALLLVGVSAASATVFIVSKQVAAAEYIIFPLLIWAALRLGPACTATAAALANVIAVWGTHIGRGPFAGAGPEQGLVLLQVFMAVAATTGLLLGAIAAQNRRAQERAEVSEGRLLMAMNAARIGVWDWKIDTGEVIWSGGLEPLHGLPRGGFTGTYDAFQKLIHPDDRDRVTRAIVSAIETRSPYDAEFRLLGPDGVVRWTAARAQVVLDGSARPIRMVGVGIDITRLKELEEELRGEARRKDEFLAMLGHELRNPLAPILNATELLESRDDEIAQQAHQIIRRQSQHLAHLVDDLLDVSRISRGKVELEKQRVTLREVVTGAADTWRHLMEQRGQELSIEIPERAIWLDVDPMRFTQVIANLLHNAAKFTPEGGRIAIIACEEDGSAVVRVRDSGHGMTEEVLAHAFDPFMQGPPSLDRPQGGLGLGLTLVRRLVELHGGTVEGKSAGQEEGSEFTLRVPVSSGSEAAAPVRAPAAAAPTGPRRILIVEDNGHGSDDIFMLWTGAQSREGTLQTGDGRLSGGNIQIHK